MGNRYYLPDTIKQHIFAQNTLHRQNVTAERFGITTRTVRRIVKNVYDHGRVSRRPSRIGRPRELSWDDITVSLAIFLFLVD